MERKTVKRKLAYIDGEYLSYLYDDQNICDCIGSDWQDECCGEYSISGNAAMDEQLKVFSKDLSEAKTFEDLNVAIETFKNTLPLSVEADIQIPGIDYLVERMNVQLYEIRSETDKEMEARRKREQKAIAKKKKQLEKLQKELASLGA
jgi:hypothetical protein